MAIIRASTRTGLTRAVSVTTDGGSPVIPSQPRRQLLGIRNNSGSTVYLAFSSGVPTADAWPIPAGESFQIELHVGSVYLYTAVGTATVNVFEVYR